MPVYAPSSIQEMVDLIQEAFDVADEYRTPCMIMGDGMLGQMMEPVEFKENLKKRDLPEKTWAANGRMGRAHHNVINSLFLKTEALWKSTTIIWAESMQPSRKKKSSMN